MNHYTINRYVRLFMILLVSSTLNAHNWESLLEQHKEIIGYETHALISKQYKEFVTGFAPKIADLRIKNILIKECDSLMVDLSSYPYVDHSRIKVMPDNMLLQAHAHPDDIDPRSNSHPCMRQEVFEMLLQMIIELDTLAIHFGYEPGDLTIYLFEGWRDIATQQLLFDTKMAQIHAANPHFTEAEAYAETATWVSPYIDNVPTHSTGAAIDIHIWSNKEQRFLDMGPFNKGGSTAPTFSQDASLQDHQKNNRLLLLAAATKAGLTNYVYEFWHYSYGDRYACFWRNNEQDSEQYHAIYGSK